MGVEEGEDSVGDSIDLEVFKNIVLGVFAYERSLGGVEYYQEATVAMWLSVGGAVGAPLV